MSSRKLEADGLMVEGDKLVKKGFFSKPKWDDGAAAFNKAANIYMNLGDIENALKASEKASNAHAQATNFYHAATVCDAVATFLKDHNRELDAPEWYCKAARYFAQANRPQQQADTLAKAARLVPADKSAEAVKWMTEGVTVLEDAERWHVIKEPFRALVILMVRAGMIKEAIETERRYITAMSKVDFPDLAAKCALEIVILCLALGDDVLAEREFQNLTSSSFGFPHSEEQRVAYELVDASTQRDEARLQEAAKDQRITFLIPDIARMAKKLKVPGGKAPARPSVAGHPSSAAAADEADAGDDDELDTR